MNFNMEDLTIKKVGDIIRWYHPGNDLAEGKVHEASVAIVDMEEQCYYVYVDYGGGQDMIPFDKILPDA